MYASLSSVILESWEEVTIFLMPKILTVNGSTTTTQHAR
jgi:hypothetical protein